MTSPLQTDHTALRAAARRARADAADRRALATRLDRSHVHELTALAGDDTWVGPTASAFQAAVRRSRQALDGAAAELRRQAVALELDAAELDRAAARAQLMPLTAG